MGLGGSKEFRTGLNSIGTSNLEVCQRSKLVPGMCFWLGKVQRAKTGLTLIRIKQIQEVCKKSERVADRCFGSQEVKRGLTQLESDSCSGSLREVRTCH